MNELTKQTLVKMGRANIAHLVAEDLTDHQAQLIALSLINEDYAHEEMQEVSLNPPWDTTAGFNGAWIFRSWNLRVWILIPAGLGEDGRQGAASIRLFNPPPGGQIIYEVGGAHEPMVMRFYHPVIDWEITHCYDNPSDFFAGGDWLRDLFEHWAAKS